MNISTVVRVHFFRERLDVLIAVLAPLALMAESGYGNAWTFAGGTLGLDFNSMNAIVRGFFLEGLIFAMFKLVRHQAIQLVERVQFMTEDGASRFDCVLALVRGLLVILIPGLIGLTGMVVSAGCNLGWATHSGEMIKVVTSVSAFLPGPILEVFKIGLGLLFPVAVGAFALLDVTHLVQDMFTSLKFQEKVIIAEEAERHIKNVKKEAKAAAESVKGQYKEYFAAEALNMVNNVKKGDRSFGLNALYKDEGKQRARGKVTPMKAVGPAAVAPSLPRGGFSSAQSFVNGQAVSLPPSDRSISGIQTITIPPSGMAPMPNRGAPSFPRQGQV